MTFMVIKRIVENNKTELILFRRNKGIKQGELMSTIKVKLLEHFDTELPLPKYETEQAAGYDIRARARAGKALIIEPGKRTLVPTGLSLKYKVMRFR